VAARTPGPEISFFFSSVWQFRAQFYFGGVSFGSYAASRNFGRSGASQPAQVPEAPWQVECVWKLDRSVDARVSSHHDERNGRGWRAFGNLSRVGRRKCLAAMGAICELTASGIRLEIQECFFGTNVSAFSSSRASGATAPNTHAPAWIQLESLFDKYTWIFAVLVVLVIFYRRSMANLGSPRFGNWGFGSSDFGNSAFGSSGFSNSFIGSNVSLIPNLLFVVCFAWHIGLRRMGSSERAHFRLLRVHLVSD